MYVFRFEHKTKSHTTTKTNKVINVGPYSDNMYKHIDKDKYISMLREHGNAVTGHNNLPMDIKWAVPAQGMRNYFCACDSVNALKKWFRGYVGLLRANGFVLVRYEVESMVMGDSGKQCFFHKNKIIGKKIV